MTSPLDDIRQLLAQLPPGRPPAPVVEEAAFAGRGRLGEFEAWIKRWSDGKSTVSRPGIAIFVGAHGLLPHGLTTETDAAARDFLTGAASGEALVAGICAASNIGLKVLELALDYATGDISRAQAMDLRGSAATMAFGMEAAAGGNDLVCLAGVGAGGDVAAATLLAALTNGDGAGWTDPAAPAHLRMRREAFINAGLMRALSACHADDGLALIGETGGREIAAIAGAIVAARMERIPVILEGLPALAAAIALDSTHKGAADHCMLAAKPQFEAAAKAAFNANLEWVSAQGLGAAPGANSALAVQTLRLAAASRKKT